MAYLLIKFVLMKGCYPIILIYIYIHIYLVSCLVEINVYDLYNLYN